MGSAQRHRLSLSMALWFILGVVVGALLLCLPLLRARRLADAAERDRRKLARDRQRVLEFVHMLTEALGEGLSKQELQQRVVHAAVVCTGALSGCFFERTPRLTMRSAAVEGLFPPHRPLSDEAKAKLTTRAKFIEQVVKTEEFPISEGIVGRVARTRKGELVRDATSDEVIVKHDDPALMVGSVIVVPLQFRDRFFGVLAVTNPVGGSMFAQDDFHLMESLAEQAAVALHNAEFLHLQMEKHQLDLDLSIASSIQRMLLPRESIRHDSMEVNARYRPAQKVGGDLYDVFPLSANRLGLVVADVSGKGIAASLLMAICRTTLRQIAPHHTSPAAVLREVNRVIEAELDTELYVTVLYAIIDTAANRLTFARAGHELPLLGRRDASGMPLLTYLAVDGMAVGMVPDDLFGSVIVDREEPFEPRDVLVLYTDGLTEAPNDEGKEFSGARLLDAVRSHVDRSPAEINDIILQRVQEFTGDRPQRDDFTLVTVKRI